MSEDILRSNRIEDVRWLCSLSESELDMLIRVKQLAARRAKVIGHESLATKFDLKMLRALSFILMEHLKGELKDPSAAPDKCKLLSSKVDENFSSMGIEELHAYIVTSKKKRIEEFIKFGERVASFQKTKNYNQKPKIFSFDKASFLHIFVSPARSPIARYALDCIEDSEPGHCNFRVFRKQVRWLVV